MKVLSFVVAAGVLQFTSIYAAEQDSSNPGASLLGAGKTPAVSSTNGTTVDVPTDTKPDASVELRGGSVAAGIGYVWGHGTMSFQGADHKFSINGVSVADVGGAKIAASGVVMHLSKLSDFEGRYVAWGAGATVAVGGSAIYMKNEHGVVIKLLSSTRGLRFNLSGNGVRIRLQS